MLCFEKYMFLYILVQVGNIVPVSRYNLKQDTCFVITFVFDSQAEIHFFFLEILK